MDLVGSATRREAILIGCLTVPIDIAVAAGAITTTRGNSASHDVIGCANRTTNYTAYNSGHSTDDVTNAAQKATLRPGRVDVSAPHIEGAIAIVAGAIRIEVLSEARGRGKADGECKASDNLGNVLHGRSFRVSLDQAANRQPEIQVNDCCWTLARALLLTCNPICASGRGRIFQVEWQCVDILRCDIVCA